MSMKEMPEMTKVDDGLVWSHTFEKFKTTVYVPANNLMDDVLNYGFIAPYMLIFAPQDFLDDNKRLVDFARENGFEKIAKKYATSVVFIYPTSPPPS